MAERDALFAASVPLDAEDPHSRRYNVRRAEAGLEFYEAKWTGFLDGDDEFHGHPTTRVPARVLRRLRDAGRLSAAEYRRAVQDLN